MNKICLIGRLTRKPELKTTQAGKSILSFSLACDRRYKKDGNDTDFFTCVAFNQQAEALSRYTDKGAQIGIEGRLQNRQYLDAEGKKRTVAEIIIEHFTFCGGVKKEEPLDDFYLLDDDTTPF